MPSSPDAIFGALASILSAADDSVQTPADLKRFACSLQLSCVVSCAVLCCLVVAECFLFGRLFEEKMTPTFEARGETFNVFIIDTATGQ